MWAYLIAVVVLVVGVVGSVTGAGIFTIVLIPIAFLIAGGAFLTGWMGSSAATRERRSQGGGDVSDRPLPHSPQRPSGRAPTSPEGLADARRTQQ